VAVKPDTSGIPGIDRGPDRHSLGQAYLGVGRIDIQHPLRRNRCIGHADASHHTAM